ncbi:hypothetical protein Tco_1052987 [Tanacetum coccineum]
MGGFNFVIKSSYLLCELSIDIAKFSRYKEKLVEVGKDEGSCVEELAAAQNTLPERSCPLVMNHPYKWDSVVKSEKSERLSEEAKRSDLKRFDSKEARRFTKARKSVVRRPKSDQKALAFLHYTRRNASASTSRASTSRTSTSTTLYDESEEDSVDEDDIVDLGNDGEIRNENLDDYFE